MKKKKTHKKQEKSLLIFLIPISIIITIVLIFFISQSTSIFQEGQEIPKTNTLTNDKQITNIENEEEQQINSIIPETENKQKEEPTPNPSLQTLYSGDIHLLINYAQTDQFTIKINNKDVFNTKTTQFTTSSLSHQVFDTVFEGENTIEIDYDDNKEDKQPIVIHIIRDGSDRVLSWESLEEKGQETIIFNTN